MKKLMIAAAIVCAAVISQGATIKWSTGGGIKTPTSATDGTFSTVNAGSGTLQIFAYVYATAAARDAVLALNDGNIWKTFQNNQMAAAWSQASAAGSGGLGVGATVDVGSSWSSTATTDYYAITITTYNADGGDVEWYIANSAKSTVNTSGTGASVSNLALRQGGGTTGTAITGWTAAVPEPTSAMLILLGMAGLALKRKRA